MKTKSRRSKAASVPKARSLPSRRNSSRRRSDAGGTSLSPRDFREQIRRNSFFAGYGGASIDRLLPKLLICRFPAGATIFDESAREKYLCLLLEGKVRIVKQKGDVITALLAVLHHGDFFGELSVIDTLPRSARVEALEKCTVAMLRGADLRELIARSHTVAKNVMRNLATRLRTIDQAFVGEIERNVLSAAGKLERLHLLVEASKTVNSAIDIDRLLFLILDAATHSIKAERGTLYLVDAEKEELWSKVVQGKELTELRMPIGKGLAGYVAKTGEVVNIPDAYRDPRFNPEIDKRSGFRTRNVLCMPMRDKSGTIVGVFQLLNKKRGSFADEDVSMIEALSVHAAIALQNAQLAQEMMRHERLSTVGRMASTIIHDLKNPMSVMRLYAQMISEALPDHEAGRYAEEMIQQVDLFVKMTQEILDFSRGVSALHRHPVVVSDFLNGELKFLELELKRKGIELRRDFQYDGRCALDAERMGRVVRNIANNAVDAMGDAGTLTIRTRREDDNFIVSFEDTGKGIPDSIRSRIFEPFFSFGKHHGTGLGLAIVKKVIDDHGGTITVESSEGGGTTMAITLPGVLASAAGAQP